MEFSYIVFYRNNLHFGMAKKLYTGLAHHINLKTQRRLLLQGSITLT